MNSHSRWESKVAASRQEHHVLKMTRRCPWCSTIMEHGDPGAETTDGICDLCAEKLLADAGIKHGEKI